MDVYTVYARSKLINFCMWAVVFTKRMMTLVTEKAFLVDVGAFDVFKRVFVFQKFVYPFFQLVGKVLYSVCNESVHFTFGENWHVF